MPEHAATAAAAEAAPLLFEARLRTEGDRAAVRGALLGAWDGGAAPGAASIATGYTGRRPGLVVAAGGVLRVGRGGSLAAAGGVGGEDGKGVPFASRAKPVAAPGGGPGSLLGLLPTQLAALEAVATGLARGRLALLTGPAGSGKTAVARAAAASAGVRLVELSLSPASDTADLLGGYEQVEPARALARAVECAREAADAAGRAAVVAIANIGAGVPTSALAAALRSIGAARAAASAADVTAAAAHGRDDGAHAAARAAAGANLIEAARATVAVGRGCVASPEGGADLDAASALADAAAAALATARCATLAAAANPSSSAGRFEWLDGALTRAAGSGAWVLLDGAGRAPPAVLDRLNPLLEPGGVLALHEAGGGGRAVPPHPAFRLLLAVDPGRGGGEVSRAMRNRGVEVWVGGVGGGGEGNDEWWPAASAAAALAFAASAEGVPAGGVLAGAMAAAVPNPATLRRWARSAAALVDRGWAPGAALADAWHDTVGEKPGPSLPGALAAFASASRAPPCAPGAPGPPAPWCGASPAGTPAARDVALFEAAAGAAVAAALVAAGVGGEAVRAAALARPSLVAWCPAALLAAGVEASQARQSQDAINPAALARVAAGLVLERAAPGRDAAERGARLRALSARADGALWCGSCGAGAILAGPASACDSPLLALATAELERARAALAASLPPAAWAASTAPPGSTPLDVAAVPLLAAAASTAGSAAAGAWAGALAASARAAAAREAALDGAALAAGAPASPPHGNPPTALQASAAAVAGGDRTARPANAPPAVAWLAPALAAVAALEGAALGVEGVAAWAAAAGSSTGAVLEDDTPSDGDAVFDCTPRAGAAPLPAALAALRSWRRAFVRATAVPVPSLCVEAVAAAWLGLAAAADTVAAAARACGGGGAPGVEHGAARVAHASGGLGAALGLPATLPPAPLLWAHGGHPLAPRSAALAAARLALSGLAAASEAGGNVIACGGEAPGSLAVAAAGAAAAAALAAAGLVDAPPAGNPPDPAAAAAAAAALAVDAAWRAALADGWALVTAASCLPDAAAGEAAAGVPADLVSRARALAGRAVSAVGADPAIAPAAAAVDAGGDGAALPLLLLLPASLMADPASRTLQAELVTGVGVSAADAVLPLLAGATAAAAGRLAGGPAPPPASPPPPPTLLRAAALLVSRSGGATDVRLAGALVSLADAVAAGGLAATTTSTSPAARAASAALAEAWLAWHAGLWSTAGGGAAPAWLTGAPGVAGAFSLTSAGARRTAARRAGARGLTLRLAARAAAGVSLAASPGAASPPAPRRAAAAASWRALGALLAHCLAAHAPAGPATLPPLAAECLAAGERAAGLAGLRPPRGGGRATTAASGLWSSDDEEEDSVAAAPRHLPRLGTGAHPLAAAVEGACAGSAHAGLADAGTRALLVSVAACLSAASGPTPPDALSPAGAALRGRAWALLGAARLALGGPAGATDPAGVSARRRDRSLAELEDVILPGLAARRAAQLCPAGPDESGALEALEASAQALQAQAETADRAAVARPTPPAYAAARAGTLAFTSGVGSPSRAAAAVEALWTGAPGAAATAAAWGDAAAVWAARAARDHPAYADVLGPALLGAAEARAGLALLAGAAVAAVSPPDTALALSSLAAWPPRPGGAATATAAGAAATRAASSRGASAPAAAAAGAAARVVAAAHALRVAARAAAGPGAGRAQATAAAGVAAPAMKALLAEWEAARDAADAAAEAEGVLFKQAKSRLAAGAAEEDDDADEAAFRAAHPDHAAAWADLAPENEGGEMEEAGPATPPPSSSTPADPDSGTAGLSLTGPALAAIVADHAALFLGGGGGEHKNDTARFAAAFDAAAGLVAAGDGLTLSPALDDDDRLAAGRLLRLALEHGAGTITTGVAPATPAGKSNKRGARGGSAAPVRARPPLPTITDMEAPAPSEAALLLPAVTALRTRLGDLLDEWPDNPVLTRIDAVAARLLDLPATAPLRAACVGVDLLLSAAQLWQETAASHVRLDAALAPLSALATRWRGAELAGWRTTLERVEADVAAGKENGMLMGEGEGGRVRAHALCTTRSFFS